MRRRAFGGVLLAVAAASWTWVAAQGQGAPLAEVSIGFRGAPVADAWNPVRVMLRDVGAGEVLLTIDQGSLLEGERPWTVGVPIAGGGGVRVIDVDVYLPAWRTLRWTVDAGGLRLASGALGRTEADRRPVDLVVSDRAGASLAALGTRVLDVAAGDLPARAAAYGGVRSVWLDGTVPLPDPAALAAAAAGGAIVVVQGDARTSAGLASVRSAAAQHDGWWGTGAGGWWFGDAPDGASLTAARLDVAALATAFAAADAVALPRFPPPLHVAVGAAAYVLLIAVAWRVGGAAGGLTWVWVVVAAGAATFVAWRADEAQPVQVRALYVASQELGLLQRAYDVATLPAAALAIDGVARPASPLLGGVRHGPRPRTEVLLDRWRAATLLEAPRAAAAALAWGADGLPRAVGGVPLTDVRVVGGGAWPRLEPGVAPDAPTDPAPLGGAEATFEALLPAGAVWARSGDDWHVALPPDGRVAIEERP
jgi:hypothetical protein